MAHISNWMAYLDADAVTEIDQNKVKFKDLLTKAATTKPEYKLFNAMLVMTEKKEAMESVKVQERRASTRFHIIGKEAVHPVLWKKRDDFMK